MTALVAFLMGLFWGLIVCWIFHLRARHQILKLEQLLPEPFQKETLPLSVRYKRWCYTVQEQLDLAQLQMESYEAVLDALPIGFLQVDHNNHLLAWNAKALALLKIRDAQLPRQGDRSVLEFVRSYDLDRLIAKVRKRQKICQKDWVLQFPGERQQDGDWAQSSQSLRGVGIPLAKASVAIVLEDRSEVDVLKQDRDRWTSDVAHEFKTPLTAIRLISETLETKIDPVLLPWIGRLQSEVMRLISLVQDILELGYGRSDMALNLVCQPVDLAQLVQSAWISLEPLAKQKDLSLYYEGPDRLDMVGDEARLYRVLLNLLDNAIKHSPDQETILVQAARYAAGAATLRPACAATKEVQSHMLFQEGWIQLDVVDMGQGFAPDVLPHIFKRFYRADKSRVRASSIRIKTPKEQDFWKSLEGQRSAFREQSPHFFQINDTMQSGTGLGLAIVQQIVVAHGGQIFAGNHPDWKGGWLQLCFPVDSTASDGKKIAAE